MRAFASFFLLSSIAVGSLACLDIRPEVDTGGDNNEGTSDIAASAGPTSSSSGGKGDAGTDGAGGAGGGGPMMMDAGGD